MSEISVLTGSVQPLDIITKVNETIPAINSSTPDSSLSPTSTNAIQNKPVTLALATKQNASTAVTHTASTAVGSTNQPVYIASDGTATVCTYSLGTSVPSDAVFTDTTYTQGTGISISDTTISNRGVISISQGSTNGTILVNTGGTSAEVTIKGLGTSAYTSTTDSVTSASTATLTSGGAYTNLVRRYSTSQATGGANQPVYIDANGQVQACNATTSSYSSTGTTAVNGTAVASAISGIEAVIPSEASADNQLADKSFVNSSITTATANFIGTFNSVAELEAYSGTLTKNDYAFVETTDTAGNTYYDRYKYNGTSWLFEYEINNSSFTANQWASINSGITANDVSAISNKQDASTAVTHTASTAVGNSSTPVYIDSDGTATALSYTIATSVPSGAVFTDTTYSTFTGANGTDPGASGLVPAPTATDNVNFLKGDGTWAPVSISGGAMLAQANTFTASNTFSSNVSLGSSATATTPTITDNDTSVATTAFARSLSTHQPLTTVTYAASQTITLTSGVSLYKLTPTGSITSMTFTLSNTSASASVAYTFELYLILNSSYTIVWPSALTWQDSEAPDLSDTGTYFFAFRTIDGGSNWIGNLQGKW